MDERPQFVARRLAGEAMAELCREFWISRKTGSTRSSSSTLNFKLWFPAANLQCPRGSTQLRTPMPHRYPGLSTPGSSAISLRAVYLPQRYPL